MHGAYVGAGQPAKIMEAKPEPVKDDMDEFLNETLGAPDPSVEEAIEVLEFAWDKQAEMLDYAGKNQDAAKLRAFATKIISVMKTGAWAEKNKGVIVSALSALKHGSDEFIFLSKEEVDTLKKQSEEALASSIWSKE